MLYQIQRKWQAWRRYNQNQNDNMIGGFVKPIGADEFKRCFQKVRAAYTEHVYRTETDPIYCLIDRERMRRFTIHMFFRDFYTFKQCLAAPWRLLCEKATHIQNE